MAAAYRFDPMQQQQMQLAQQQQQHWMMQQQPGTMSMQQVPQQVKIVDLFLFQATTANRKGILNEILRAKNKYKYVLIS